MSILKVVGEVVFKLSSLENCCLNVAAYVFRLAAGGAFTHYRSFRKPHFNFTKKLPTEAMHPRLRQTDVTSSYSFIMS